MKQCLHLLVVDWTNDLVLVDSYQERWVLPVFGSQERTRVAPLAMRLAAGRATPGQVVGQWLGRVSACPDAVDWVVVVRARAGSADSGASTWTSPSSLRTRSAVLDYQQWALERMLAAGGRLRVPGPFGHPDWPDAVHAWVETAAGAGRCDDVVTYRITAHAVVMRLPTSVGPLYFKGLASPAASEATLTIALANLAPDSFARTHALETGPEGEAWWLTKECPGATLASDPTVERAMPVARECGRLQRCLPVGILDRLTPVLPVQAAAWSIALLETLGTGPEIDQCCACIHAACRDVVQARAPVAWIPLDLDPSNVIVHGGEVRFIDLDESYRGPAPLAVTTFVRRFRRLARGRAVTSDCDRLIYAAYERGLEVSAFAPSLWRAFEIVSILLETQAGWRRVSRNLERGELHAPLDIIERRVAERLMRAVLADAATTQG